MQNPPTIKPGISIITPCLNSERYIEQAILSVLEQGADAVEHIIVDGGSTDGTVSILKKYPHLTWTSEPDHGQSHAMNKGFAMASREIIGYLNADDYYQPGAFSAVLSRFGPEVDFVVGKVRVVNEKGDTIWVNDGRVSFFEMLEHWEPEAFCVNSVGYFYRRGIQIQVGGFNEQNHFAMDLEFLLRAARICPLVKIDHQLGVYRFYAESVTGKSLRQESTWTRSSFQFIDHFLEGLSHDFVTEYQQKRIRGYAKRILWQKMDQLTKMRQKEEFRGVWKWLYKTKKQIILHRLKKRIEQIESEIGQHT